MATEQNLPGGKHGKDEKVQQQLINTVRRASCKRMTDSLWANEHYWDHRCIILIIPLTIIIYCLILL